MIGTVLFFGAIVASFTVYFTRRRERNEMELINTIKRNLDDLDGLTQDELELLKESTNNVINLQLEQVRARNMHRR